MELGQKLQILGDLITNLGYKIIPISFIAYFILVLLELKLKKQRKSKLCKSIWYLAVGIGNLCGDKRIEQLVIMMIFFDAFDSFVEYKIEEYEWRKKRIQYFNLL